MNKKDIPGIKVWLVYNVIVSFALICLFVLELFTDRTFIKELYGLPIIISYLVPILALFLGLAIIYGYKYDNKILYYSSIIYCLYVIIMGALLQLISSFNVSHTIGIVIFLAIGYSFLKQKNLYLK